jgi:hypothetical protein
MASSSGCGAGWGWRPVDLPPVLCFLPCPLPVDRRWVGLAALWLLRAWLSCLALHPGLGVWVAAFWGSALSACCLQCAQQTEPLGLCSQLQTVGRLRPSRPRVTCFPSLTGVMHQWPQDKPGAELRWASMSPIFSLCGLFPAPALT